jgi:hypothetical protein
MRLMMGKRAIDRRDIGVMLRVTEAERALFKHCAAELGLAVGSWMRMMLLERANAQHKKQLPKGGVK